MEELKKVPIPISHAVDLSDLTNFVYPNDSLMPRITQKEMLHIGNSLHSNKAPGPDQISNKVIKVIMLEITDHLEQIFNDSSFIGYYPEHFRESIIIILRKLEGNRDYTNPKNYRPIRFLNTIGKIIEAIIAARIS